MSKNVNIGNFFGKTIGFVSGISMVILSLIASPFVLWMLAGDDEGSSFSIASIILLIIVGIIFIAGIALVNLSTKRKDKK